MNNITIDSNEIRRLSAKTIAGRYPVRIIKQAILSLGYSPAKGKAAMSVQLKEAIEKPKPILEIGPAQIAKLSPSTIANRYKKSEMMQAIEDWSGDWPDDAPEETLAYTLLGVAERYLDEEKTETENIN